MLRSLLVWCLLIASLPIAFLRPFAGLLIYLGFAHARIANFVWANQAIQNWGLLIIAPTLLGYFLFEIHNSPPHFYGLKTLLALWVWLAVTSLFAYDSSLSFPKLYQYSTIFVITIVIAAMANSEERIRALITTIGVSVGSIGSKGAVDFLRTGGQFRMQGPGGLVADENEYALVLDMAMPILFWLAATEDRRWLRWVFRGMAVGCGVTVIGTRSRSGFLGLLLATFLLVFYSRRKMAGLVGLGLACLMSFVIVPHAAVERYQSIPTADEQDASAISRLQMWRAAAGMVKANPITGVGLRNFESAVPRFSSAQPRAPHNAFVALAAEAGIPACLLFIGLIFSAIWRMFWLRRRLLRDSGDWRLASYCLILQISLTVYLVPNLFINRQDLDLMYHLIGVSAGLAMVAHRRLAQRSEEASSVLEPDWAAEAASV
jgi:putative inorganic carbon (hco3(-)) transporter